MKFPKSFLLFLLAFQTLLTGGHLLLYKALVWFFPILNTHRQALLFSLLALSVAFLTASVFDFQKENPLLRWIYILAAVWLPAWLYLLFAAATAALISVFFPALNPSAIAWPIFGLAVLIAIYGIINARWIRVVRLQVSLPNLPEFWKNKTAVMVSNLHLGHVLREGFARTIVKKIQNLQPEIVLIPGDFYDGVHTAFPALAASFKDLRPPQGIYFCSGNHELYAGMQACEQALGSAGIIILDNKKIDLQGLQLAGLGYAQNQTDANIKDGLRRLNLDPQQPSILLKHIPAQIPVIADAGVSLQLSGHTHQAQVWPLNYIAKWEFKGFDYGLKHFKQLLIYTSSGVGTWGPPVRIFTKSEIVQITFN